MHEEPPHEDIATQSDRTPFPERTAFLVEDGPAMTRLSEHPNLVIRKEKLRLAGVAEDGPTGQKALEYLREGRNIFEAMRGKYGVSVPDFQYIIGENDVDGMPWLYTMTEKIEGKDLSKVETFTKKEIDLVDTALSGAITQLSDSQKQGDRYWIDIDVSQFMLGRRDGDAEAAVYLVDLEPRTAKWGGNQGEVLAKIHSLLEGIESIESRGQGEILSASRARLRELFCALHEPAPNDEYFREPLLEHYRDLDVRI